MKAKKIIVLLVAAVVLVGAIGALSVMALADVSLSERVNQYNNQLENLSNFFHCSFGGTEYYLKFGKVTEGDKGETCTANIIKKGESTPYATVDVALGNGVVFNIEGGNITSVVVTDGKGQEYTFVPHVHNTENGKLEEYVVSCTKAGADVYQCDECGWYFENEDCTGRRIAKIESELIDWIKYNGTEAPGHDWVVGEDNQPICNRCGKNCKASRGEEATTDHVYDKEEADGICTHCGYECGHVYDPKEATGKCTLCGKAACGHVYDKEKADGKCTICGKVCAHNFDSENPTGFCKACGMSCKASRGEEATTDHVYDKEEADGICTHCGYECGHVFDKEAEEKGICEICGKACEHEYDTKLADGICTICGKACPHNFNKEEPTGKCKDCGKSCKDCRGEEATTDHVYDKGKADGKCTTCGYECAHVFDKEAEEKGICTICGKACEHAYDTEKADGICTICGKACEHTTWAIDEEGKAIGKCICGKSCKDCREGEEEDKPDHVYDKGKADGKCTTCGYECGHVFDKEAEEKGFCTICGKECEHEYDTEKADGICTLCGKICEHNNTWAVDKETGKATGKCVCGKACDHKGYENACVCEICKLNLNHNMIADLEVELQTALANLTAALEDYATAQDLTNEINALRNVYVTLTALEEAGYLDKEAVQGLITAALADYATTEKLEKAIADAVKDAKKTLEAKDAELAKKDAELVEKDSALEAMANTAKTIGVIGLVVAVLSLGGVAFVFFFKKKA